jgi:hypothetical protein
MRRSRSYAPSFVRCPWGTRIQSLLLSKREFDAEEALAWVESHGFSTRGFDQSANYWRARQAEPSSFAEGSLRTITLGRGQSRVRAIIGCPRSRPARSRRRR